MTITTQPIPLSLDSVRVKIPEAQIAQYPLPNRGDSRLLVRAKDGKIAHDSFRNIGNWLENRTLFVVNQSKVFKSRLFAEDEAGKKIEIFLLERLKEETFGRLTGKALARPLKRLQVGTRLRFSEDFFATVLSRESQSATLAFDLSLKEAEAKIEALGATPLPPYIRRKAETEDSNRYQCVWAGQQGSVAAPTAGLHFDRELISQLQGRGMEFAEVTLHVGAGTFMPIKTQNISEHKMHTEAFCIAKDQLEKILKAKAENRPIVCVGTTSLRSMQSLYEMSGSKPILDLADQWHHTDLFIYPKHADDLFNNYFADALITNFHQPNSSLFFLVSALIGFHNTEAMYEEAVQEGYRFFSYGDTSLLKLR